MEEDAVLYPENEIKKDDYNYKGYFIENAEADEEPHLYEFGAHFSYKELYKILEALRKKQLKMQKGQKIENILQINKKKESTRKKNNTKNKYFEKENNLNNIMNIFKTKGRSRNILKEEEKDELTFIPKNNFKNILSLKKENKSITKYKSNFSATNYLKIYKNKINNIKLNPVKFGILSEKYLLTKKNQKNFLYQRMKLFSKKNQKNNQESNKSNNKYSYDISLQRSFQTQIKQVKNNSKKKIRLNILPFFSNSKPNLDKNKKSHLKEINIKTSESNLNKPTTKKIQLTNKKDLKKEIMNSIPLNNLISDSKSKINKENENSKEKKIKKLNNSSNKLKNQEEKIISLKKYLDIDLNKNINNENSNHNINNKAAISVSIDNNNIEIYTNEKINKKIKPIKRQINVITNSYLNKSRNLMVSNLNDDFQNSNNYLIKIDKIKKKLNNKKSKESLNIFIDNNKKTSRNKLNSFMKNIGLTNFAENKTLYNNLSRVNNTQQNLNYFKKFGMKNGKKNVNSSKYFILGSSSNSNSNKKKSFPLQLLNNNYYSTGFIIKKYPDKKIKYNNTYMSSIHSKESPKIVDLKGIKSNKKSNKELIKKNILKSKSNIEKINKAKNELKRCITNLELSQSYFKMNSNKGFIQGKKYQNLINNNYNNKNNINININISNNNNNINFNSNFNNNIKNGPIMNLKKSNLSKNLIVKENLKSGQNDKLKKGNFQNIIYNKDENSKVKFINIQFPKAKFLNILKSDDK